MSNYDSDDFLGERGESTASSIGSSLLDASNRFGRYVWKNTKGIRKELKKGATEIVTNTGKAALQAAADTTTKVVQQSSEKGLRKLESRGAMMGGDPVMLQESGPAYPTFTTNKKEGFLDRFERMGKEKRRRRYYWMGGIAAAAILIILIVIIWTVLKKKKEE